MQREPFYIQFLVRLTKKCHHQLKRPPDLVTDVEGTSYLLSECLLCGCGIGMRLKPEGEIEGELVIPAARKCA